MTRRRLGHWLASGGAGVGTLLAAACGAGAPSGASGQAQDAAGAAAPQATRFAKAVAIEYWKSLAGAAHDAQVNMTDAFNASRTDVTVNLVDAGGYDQAAEKFLAAAAGNTAPDVMIFTDSYGRNFSRMGLLAPVDEFLKGDKEANAANYVPALLRDGQVGGRQFQIPFARSTELLYVNKDHLRYVGLPETGPATWSGLLEASQKLVHGGVLQPSAPNGDERQAFSALALWWSFQSMLWNFGGRFSDEQFTVTIGEPPAVEAGQFLADLAHRTRVARPYKSSGDARKDFVEGRLSLLIMSSAGLVQTEKDAPFRVGASFMPTQRQQAVHSGGSGLNLVSASPREKKEAGWEFIKHLTTTENTISFAQATGYMAVRSDAAERPIMQKYLEEHPNARVSLDQGKIVRTTDAVMSAPDAIKYVDDGLARILLDQAPVRQTFEQLALELKQAAAKVPGR